MPSSKKQAGWMCRDHNPDEEEEEGERLGVSGGEGTMFGVSAPRSNAPLASFKAGKMTATPIENRFRVEADERRGLALLEKGGNGATHFIWKDRQTLQVVDDLLVFPGGQTLEKDPDASKDEERIKEFNRIMNEPPRAATSNRGGPAIPSVSQQNLTPAVGLDELSNILSGLGYNADAATSESATATEESMQGEAPSEENTDKEGEEDNDKSGKEESNKTLANDAMRRVMEQLSPSIASNTISDEDMLRALDWPSSTPNLASILTGDALDEFFRENPEEIKQALISLLPEGRQTEEELRTTFRSPQLRQSLVQLSRALNSENLDMVLASFGLDITAGLSYLQTGDGTGAFLAALEDQAAKNPPDPSNEKEN